MRQMILARAFPDVDSQHRLNLITQVFDFPETLDHLCVISGGHIRNLLVLLYSCLQKQDPPISRQSLEEVIQELKDLIVRAITTDEWKLLNEVKDRKSVHGEDEYKTLIPSLFVFEYKDKEGKWFSINPLLADVNQLNIINLKETTENNEELLNDEQ